MSEAPHPHPPRRGDADRKASEAREFPSVALYDLEIIEAVLFAAAMEEDLAEGEEEGLTTDGGSDPRGPRSREGEGE